MKKLILFTAIFLTFGFVSGQTIQAGNYSTTGYVKSDGTIQNSSYSTVGHIKPDGTIQNSSYSTIGYIKSDGTIQNSSYSTVGYVKSDGTVQNSSYSTIGYVKDDVTQKALKRSGPLWCSSFLSLSDHVIFRKGMLYITLFGLVVVLVAGGVLSIFKGIQNYRYRRGVQRNFKSAEDKNGSETEM